MQQNAKTSNAKLLFFLFFKLTMKHFCCVMCKKLNHKIWVRLNPDWTVFYCGLKENTNFPLFWGFCLFVFFLPFSASRQQRCEHTSGCHRRKQTKLPIQVSFTTSVGGHKEESLFVCLLFGIFFFFCISVGCWGPSCRPMASTLRWSLSSSTDIMRLLFCFSSTIQSHAVTTWLPSCPMLAPPSVCMYSPQEPMDVVELFGLKGVQHTPISIKNARVSQVWTTWLRPLWLHLVLYYWFTLMLSLCAAALQGQSDRHLQPLPCESHAPLLPIPPQQTNRKLKILNYLLNCLFPYFLRTPTLPSSWRKTWMSLSTSLGTRAPFTHHTWVMMSLEWNKYT